MLHIIILLLKIIGWILVALVLFLLLTALVVLFVPLRYQVSGSYYDDNASLSSRITWLLHFILVRIEIVGKQKRILLRIAGIRIWDSSKPKKKISKQNSKKNRMKTRNKNRMKTRNKNHTSREQYDRNIITSNRIKPVMEVTSDLHETETVKDNSNILQIELSEKKKGILLRIVLFFKKIIHGVHQIITKVLGGWNKMLGLNRKIFELWKKKNEVTAFLKEPVNQRGMKAVLKSLMDVCKHSKPKKLRGSIHFGTGDPCSTGQVLGVAGIFYGIYKKSFSIQPDFDKKVLEGELYLCGRIRFIAILKVIIQLIRNKDFQSFRNNAKQFKEEF